MWVIMHICQDKVVTFFSLGNGLKLMRDFIYEKLSPVYNLTVTLIIV